MNIRKSLLAGLSSLVLACSAYAGTNETDAAINEILYSASESQVVMFGEIHPLYRKDNDFVISLLPSLRSEGFDYLAIELPREVFPHSYVKTLQDYASDAISRSDIDTNHRIEIAVYTPGWLDLIDSARGVGMIIVPYDLAYLEDSDSLSDLREETDFGNLSELIFNKDPGAKVVIYCGGFHLNEESSVLEFEGIRYNKIKWLGQYIDEYTGGNSLTVSFTDNFGMTMPYADFSVLFE